MSPTASLSFPWTGRPTDPPALALAHGAHGEEADASWNGASAVARWELLGGRSATSLAPLATVPSAGFETSIALQARAALGRRARARRRRRAARALPRPQSSSTGPFWAPRSTKDAVPRRSVNSRTAPSRPRTSTVAPPSRTSTIVTGSASPPKCQTSALAPGTGSGRDGRISQAGDRGRRAAPCCPCGSPSFEVMSRACARTQRITVRAGRSGREARVRSRRAGAVVEDVAHLPGGGGARSCASVTQRRAR